MDLPTQTHLTTLRNLLNDRLAELRADVRADELQRQDAAIAGVSEVADHEDEALREQFEQVDCARERRDIDELGEVETALHRLDAGVYGDCADCGEPIDVQRLLAQPAALRCAACQTTYEGARVHGGQARR